jgi:hypothetical protein
MAVKYTAAVMVVLYGPLVDEERRRTWMLADDVISIVARGLVLILAAYAIAMKLGQRRFERVLARSPGPDASTAVARMARSVDGWSVGLVIAGATSMVTLVVVGTLVVGWDGWDRFWCFGCDPEEAIFHDRLHDLTAVIVCIAVAGAAVGWACARSRGARWLAVLEHRLVVPGALLVGAAAAWGWVARASASGASSGLRTGLTVVMAIALFGVVSGVVVRLRRREQEGLEVAKGALGVADERAVQVVGLAGVYRLRVARMVGGAVALAYAVAMVVVLHDPFDGSRVGGRSNWRDWFVHGRLDRLALVLLLTLKAYVVAAHLAGRVFERRVGRSREPVELGRRLVLGVDGWSVAMGIAGASAVVCVLAMVKLTVGDFLWVFFQSHGPRVDGALKNALRDLELVCVFVVTASLAIGRACACGARRPRWLCALEHRAAMPLGMFVGLVAAVVGRGLDFGVFDISLPPVERPSTGLQVALCAMYATAAVLIVGGYTARRRRAEQERLALPR